MRWMYFGSINGKKNYFTTNLFQSPKKVLHGIKSWYLLWVISTTQQILHSLRLFEIISIVLLWLLLYVYCSIVSGERDIPQEMLLIQRLSIRTARELEQAIYRILYAIKTQIPFQIKIRWHRLIKRPISTLFDKVDKQKYQSSIRFIKIQLTFGAHKLQCRTSTLSE